MLASERQVELDGQNLFWARFRKAQFVAKTPLQFAADLRRHIWQRNAFFAEIRHI